MPQRVVHAWWVVAGIAGLVLVVLGVLVGADIQAAARRGPRWKRKLLSAALAVLAALGVAVGAGRAEAKGEARPGGEAAGSAPKAAAKAAGLAEAPQWQSLMKVWAEAEAVSSGRRGAYPFNTDGKKKLLAEIAGAAKSVQALAEGKLLTDAEAGLLTKELDRLIQGVRRKRPTELKMATCYDPMLPLTWPYYSLRRLEGRLKLLGKLAASDVLHAAAARKVLAAVREDIKNSEDPKYLGRLTGEKKTRAQATLASAKAAADRIEAKLAKRQWPAGTGAKLQWQIVRDAWAVAKPLAESGKSTTDQRKKADQKLKDAVDAVGELVKLKEITEAEAALLGQEAASIRREMVKNPPTDCRVTCYDMAYIPPARASLTRLRQRAALLEKLALAGKVHPDVALRILPAVQADLAVLANPKLSAKIPPNERKQAKKVAATIEAAIKKIEKTAEKK